MKRSLLPSFLLTVIFLIPASASAQDLRDRIRQLQNTVAFKNEQIRQLQHTIGTLYAQIDKLKKEKSASFSKLADAYRALTKLYRQKERENLELNELVAALEELQSEIEKENGFLQRENLKLLAENQRLKKEKKDLEIENKRLELEKDSLYFIHNLRIVAHNCLDYAENWMKFSFVVISDGTRTKKEVGLIIYIEQKEKTSGQWHSVTHISGEQFMHYYTETEVLNTVKFESGGAFESRNGLFGMRNTNYLISFILEDSSNRAIIGQFSLVDLKNECPLVKP